MHDVPGAGKGAPHFPCTLPYAPVPFVVVGAPMAVCEEMAKHIAGYECPLMSKKGEFGFSSCNPFLL